MFTTNDAPMNFLQNPVKTMKHLEQAGFTKSQAEAQIEVLTNHTRNDLATKRDVNDLRIELKRDIKELRLELKKDLKALEVSLAMRIGVIVSFFYALDRFF